MCLQVGRGEARGSEGGFVVRKSLVTLLMPAVALLAACGSSSSSSSASSAAPATSTTSTATSTSTTTSAAPAASTVQLGTRSLPGLGVVLVNGQGRTLYVFAPDKHEKVTCVDGCATAWPPVKVAAGQKPGTSGQVKATIVSSDPDPAGGRVVTYAGWPLYTFVGDPSAGTAHGQALNSSGGLWWVITPSGALITKKAAAGSGSSSTSTSSSGGSGY
jgi:predicted lipoprotein with Yx(FWY)xxD motif